MIRSLQDCGQCTKEAFGHPHKRASINKVWKYRDVWFGSWQKAKDKLAFLETMPHIGPITKFHLAKNFGVDCFKPDRHIVRIAARYKQTPDDFMRGLSERTGDNLAMVDMVLWRAAEQRMI